MVPSATGRRVLGASMAVIVLVIWSDGCAKSDDPSANGSGGDASPDASGAGAPASASLLRGRVLLVLGRHFARREPFWEWWLRRRRLVLWHRDRSRRRRRGRCLFSV